MIFQWTGGVSLLSDASNFDHDFYSRVKKMGDPIQLSVGGVVYILTRYTVERGRACWAPDEHEDCCQCAAGDPRWQD